MRFAERLRSGQFAVTLEITPPQRPLRSVLLRRARAIGACADAVNVIQRPGRQSSLDASVQLLHAGIEPVWHIVTRGATREAVTRDLQTARDAGIHQLLVIRGDHAAADAVATPSIKHVVAMTRETVAGACIGVTLNQYVPDRGAVVRNLLPKLRAGAEFVQTQPVFEVASVEPFVDAVRAEFPAARFVAMVVPLLSPAAVEGIQRRLGFRLPAAMAAGLAAGSEAGWDLFGETLTSLVSSRLVDGVAIMTTEMDPPPAVGERIVEALRAAGIACSP